MELDMRPYTKEGLARQQRQQQQKRTPNAEGEQARPPRQAASSSHNNDGGDANEPGASAEKAGRCGGGCSAERGGDAEPEEEEAYPDAYYQYKLAGVLVHMGTADSGHYYSYIKRRDAQVCTAGLALRVRERVEVVLARGLEGRREEGI